MRKPLSFLMLSDQPFHKYINHFYPMIIRAFFNHLNNFFLIIHKQPSLLQLPPTLQYMSGLWEIEPNISSFLLLYHQFRLLATAKYTHGLLLFHRQTLQSQRKLCFHRGKMRDRKLFHRRCLYVNTSGQDAPDIPYTNELSAYPSDYY